MTPHQTSFLPPTTRIPPLNERLALVRKLLRDVAAMRFWREPETSTKKDVDGRNEWR